MPTVDTNMKWQTLSRAANLIKSPNSFIKNLLWGPSTYELLTTETAVFGVLKGDREIAPFVRRGSASVMVEGYEEEERAVVTPNIRISRPVKPSEYLEKRTAGTPHFVNARTHSSAYQQRIAKDLSRLSTLVDNNEEWLCAQALTGTITYSLADSDAYTVTFGRDADNTIDVSAAPWDTATNPVEGHFMQAAEVINDATGLNPTDCIMAGNVADAFMANTSVRALLDTRNVEAGNITFMNQIRPDGALYLGRFVHGIRCWRYGRSVIVNGSSVPLIRANHAEFVCATPSLQNAMFYGVIDDTAVRGGPVPTRRFSKSWETQDPAARMFLMTSRPLPVPKKVDAYVSMEVL